MIYRIYALTLGLLTPLALGGCALDLSDSCGNVISNTSISPDGNWQAVVFQRDCGATTGFSTQVSVLPRKAALPNDGGNIFTCDDDHGKAPSSVNGGPDVAVKWLSNKQLKISYDVRTRVFEQQKQYGEIAVVYEVK